MLTMCPECELQVSDKAYNCPHCGYPLRETSRPANRSKKSSGHRRLPNGFGQITEIKGKYLRNPWRAMVTTGFTSTGRPVCKILKPQGYFPTYNDAYKALVEYNKNPYDLDEDVTVKELYDKWTDYYFATLKSVSSVRTITGAWNYCSGVYDMRAKDLRARHIKACMEEGTFEDHYASAGVKSRIKSLFNLMLDYAVEYEIVDRNYSRTFNLSDEIIDEMNDVKRGHISFTDDEMKKLWENINVPYVDIILMQCYMGWRPQEIGNLKISDVDFSNWTIKGGMKTSAGIDRVVPIHSCIRSIILKHAEKSKSLNSEYLFSCISEYTHRANFQLTYDKYNGRFKKVMDALNINSDHRPHDPRKTFVTMAKKYNVDEFAIKKIVGHEINDITEKVYTDRPLSWYSSEVEKIKGPI